MAKRAKVLSTDVLVMGGGIAGLCAANKAADQGVNVLMVDKANVPWTGQLPTSGGGFSCIPPDKTEMQVKFIVEEGEYLSDQDFTRFFVKETYPCLHEMAEWGTPFKKGLDGKLLEPLGRLSLHHTEMCLPVLQARALEKGVKVLNRVYMVDLLKQDGRITGAVGFHYHTGDFYIIQARATIIASGGCNYKSRALFHTNCGEGVAMAYNAGAELRNAEFANTFMVSNKYSSMDTRMSSMATNYYENALGESMVKKYPELDPILDPSTPPWMGGLIFRRWIRAFYREIAAGRGPIYLNYTRKPEAALGFGDGFRPRELSHGYVNMVQKAGIDLTKERVEWTIVPEFHGGPVRVDLNCETTLPGLYATGDACQNGSAYEGALEGCGLSGGVPLGFAAVTGFRAGIAAGKAARKAPEPKYSAQAVSKMKREIFAPLDAAGAYTAYDAIKDIQTVVFKLTNSYIKSKDRLENSLAVIDKVKAKLPSIAAKDTHELVRYHEARAMALNAETLFKASLMRTETRGTNIREDFPKRDDKNWMKWIIIKKQDSEMKFSTEPVPIEKYKYKPG
jgi:succinate dehydrogenase / fumarate reductase flavoprotein subunit